METQRPQVQTKTKYGSLFDVTKEDRGQIAVQELLEDGSSSTAHQLSAPAFKNTLELDWVINGEISALHMIVSAPMSPIMGADMKIEWLDHATDRVEIIDSSAKDELDFLTLLAHSVARVYEAFASANRVGYVDWHEAAGQYRLLDAM